MNGSLLGVLLRLVLALAVVLLLMWVAARILRNVAGGRNTGVLELVARQPLGRTSSVAVLRVADQALVVGVTDGKVTLLTEVDLDMVEAAAAAEEERRAARAGPVAVAGRLNGSIISPATWRQAVNAVRDRTARRG